MVILVYGVVVVVVVAMRSDAMNRGGGGCYYLLAFSRALAGLRPGVFFSAGVRSTFGSRFTGEPPRAGAARRL